MDTTVQKKCIRDAIQEHLQHLPPHTLGTESRLICKRLTDLLPPKPFVLAAFFPLTTEPDIRPFLSTALKRGIELYLPTAGNGYFTFRRITDLRHLRIGPWNIPEPSEDSLTLNPSQLQYTLVPGRAFDQRGWRIGRGGAGYDRWIRIQRKENAKTLFWGLAFECQILPTVPHVDHDERMDGIVTARGLIVTGNPK